MHFYLGIHLGQIATSSSLNLTSSLTESFSSGLSLNKISLFIAKMRLMSENFMSSIDCEKISPFSRSRESLSNTSSTSWYASGSGILFWNNQNLILLICQRKIWRILLIINRVLQLEVNLYHEVLFWGNLLPTFLLIRCLSWCQNIEILKIS